MKLRWLCVAALVLSTTTRANVAFADVPEWNPAYAKFRPAEWAFAAGTGLQVVAATFANEPTRNWEGGILFDDWFRDGLRASTRDGRTAAATASDFMYYALIAYPLLDAPITSAVRGIRETAYQTLAINLEGYAISGAYAILGEKFGRARPMASECEANAAYDRRCEDKPRLNQSFMSGHTSIAFAGAGLTCAHHLHLPIYGGGAPDVAACVAALTVASVQGTLRVVSDNHYATDVILGAGLGLLGGYVVPWLLHYRTRETSSAMSVVRYLAPTIHSRELGVTAIVTPSIGPSMLGVTMTGGL